MPIAHKKSSRHTPYTHKHPFMSGYLPVGDGHRIFYSLYGNQRGKPVLFVHGGPGAGSSKRDARFFDPRRYLVITFDQRGCGRSMPESSLHANTTQKLAADMKKLLSHLGIRKAIIFGGSWGSTLALIFAIKNPQMVSRLVLRGIFLGTPEENHYFTHTARNMYPEAWENMISLVPRGKDIMAYYHKQTRSKNAKTRAKHTRAWATYEFSISKLIFSKEVLQNTLREVSPDAFSRIELHYLTNNCFLPKNYILRRSSRIRNIPAHIVHGRYDCVCNPLYAYLLHKALPKSTLKMTIAGHSAGDDENQEELLSIMNRLRTA